MPRYRGIRKGKHPYNLRMALGPPRIRLNDGRMNVVGERVAAARRDAKLTQDQLCAKIADITHGKWIPTRKDIYRVEAGTRIVSDLELIALALALKCDVIQLILGSQPKSAEILSIFRD